MGERAEFIGTYENMGLDVWSVDDQIADIRNRIVRCRDCEELSDALGTPWCDEFDHGTSLNGYCAWGKRSDA